MVTSIISDAYKKPKQLGIRHLQALMLCLGNLVSFAIKVNMSLAIVAMTDPTQNNSFDWNIEQQSMILTASKWGYLLPLLPAGELARRFGGKPIVCWCFIIIAVPSLLQPIIAKYGGWQSVCACRVLQGCALGSLLPAITALVTQWAPLEEKSRTISFIYGGGQLGTAIQLLVSGFIAEYWGWAAIFYIDGALALAWLLLYMFLGASSPRRSHLISQEELNYIEKSLYQVGEEKKLKTPWKALLTSVPVWALVISTSGFHWGYWTLFTEMPTYMSQVLSVKLSSNGVLSAVPYLTSYITCFPFGYLSDHALKKNWVSITACRKISDGFAFLGPAFTLIAMSYAPDNATIFIILLSIAIGLSSGIFSGSHLVHMDMSPNFSSVTMGLSVLFGSAVAQSAPYTVSALVKDVTSQNEWRKVFFLATAVYIITYTVFAMFGTSERQQWNYPPSDDEEKNTENNVKT